MHLAAKFRRACLVKPAALAGCGLFERGRTGELRNLLAVGTHALLQHACPHTTCCNGYALLGAATNPGGRPHGPLDRCDAAVDSRFLVAGGAASYFMWQRTTCSQAWSLVRARSLCRQAKQRSRFAIPDSNLSASIQAMHGVDAAPPWLRQSWMVLELAGLVLAGNSKSGSGRNRPK